MQRGRESSFIWRLMSAPFRSLLGGTNRDSVARPLARPLTPSSNKPKPKWGSKPHLRSLWLHSISPLISDPPHKLLSGREGRREGARDMKRSSTLLVTPSPTAREEKAGGRTGGRACLSDGWMEEEGERMQRRLRGGPLHRKERAASLARQGCTETQEGIESRREGALKRRTAVSAARLICLTTNSGKKTHS